VPGRFTLSDELIDFNAFERIALDQLLKQSSKASDYEVDPYTADERAALIAAARPDEAPMLRLRFGTGLRPGELMALRWMKIDWTIRKARIDLNLVAGAENGSKTATGLRDIDLSEGVLAALIA
jgi:integrase